MSQCIDINKLDKCTHSERYHWLNILNWKNRIKNLFVWLSEQNVEEVWQGSDDDINVWGCSLTDSHDSVSPLLSTNHSPVSGVIDQWGGRKVSQHVTMVTRYLRTSRRSHATEHQRYLQMVKNIFISRTKYLSSTHMLFGWNMKWERKAFCGTLSKWTVSFQFARDCPPIIAWVQVSTIRRLLKDRRPHWTRSAPPTALWKT